MGRSTFICPVADTESFKKAVRDLIQHDTTEMVQLGTFTEAEFEALDPLRAGVARRLRTEFPDAEISCQEHWTRGEPISRNPVLVMFEGVLWLEVGNEGLGASTMSFLRTQGQAAWQKPGELQDPEGFERSPMVAECDSLRELAEAHKRLSAP